MPFPTPVHFQRGVPSRDPSVLTQSRGWRPTLPTPHLGLTSEVPRGQLRGRDCPRPRLMTSVCIGVVEEEEGFLGVPTPRNAEKEKEAAPGPGGGAGWSCTHLFLQPRPPPTSSIPSVPPFPISSPLPSIYPTPAAPVSWRGTETQKQDKQNRRGLGRSIPELKITRSAGLDKLEASLPPLQGSPSPHPTHPPTHTPVSSQLGLQSEKSRMLSCCLHTGPQAWGHSQEKGTPTPGR